MYYKYTIYIYIYIYIYIEIYCFTAVVNAIRITYTYISSIGNNVTLYKVYINNFSVKLYIVFLNSLII